VRDSAFEDPGTARKDRCSGRRGLDRQRTADGEQRQHSEGRAAAHHGGEERHPERQQRDRTQRRTAEEGETGSNQGTMHALQDPSGPSANASETRRKSFA
jgi:hypothetical protein